jgi:hypothetical protein
MHNDLNLESRTTSNFSSSSSTNTANHDPYGPTATLSMMPARENIQVNDKFQLHSTVEPQTTDPAKETAPKVPEFQPPNVSTRETAPKVSKFEPPTIPLAAFVSLLLYTQPLPYATLNPEELLLPELEALQYKESTPLKKSVSQLTDQVLLATENSAVVAQAPWPVLPPTTENPVVVAQTPWPVLPPRTIIEMENSAVVAQVPAPVLPPTTERPVVVAQARWPVLPPAT